MLLTCQACARDFDAPAFRGYCEDCLAHFKGLSDRVRAAQRPGPGMFLDGKFVDDPCPRSFPDPVTGRPVCGLCGSDELHAGYGLGSGRGMGGYNFCDSCKTFLDFVEDVEE